MSLLHKLTSITDKSKKRVGRGYGSGKGSHTVGRGGKGQTSRVGSNVAPWFEGGQLPLVKRLPMLRGKGRFSVVRPVAEITLSELNRVKAETVTLETLRLEGLVSAKFKMAKIIASGKITKAVTVKGIRVTKTAQTSIEQAGGAVVQ